MWDSSMAYLVGAAASIVRVTASSDPTKPDEIEYFSFPSSSILSLRLSVLEVAQCPLSNNQVKAVGHGGTWAAFYTNLPNELPNATKNTQLQSSTTPVTHFISILVKPQLLKTDLYAFASGRGLKPLQWGTTAIAASNPRCFDRWKGY
jgi:hypothetical protein